MRMMAFGIVFVLLLASISPAMTADQPRLKGLGEMSIEEVRDEARQRYRADVPFAAYIKAIMDEADKAWPTLNETGRISYQVRVYWPVVNALRNLTGVKPLVPRLALTAIAEPLERLDPDMTRQHIEARLAEIARRKSATRPTLPATMQDH